MAPPSLLLRFKIELSDIDRSKYETFDFRLAQHPSETSQFLITRVIAYCLSYEDGLEFAPGGISDTDEPSLSLRDPSSGGYRLCIEVGSPSPKRVHKDMKASRRVKIFTFKNPDAFVRELAAAQIHKVEDLEVYWIDPKFLDLMSARITKDNRWSVMHTEGTLTISVDDESEVTEVHRKQIL